MYTTTSKNKIKIAAHLLPVLPIVKRDQDIASRLESSKQVILHIFLILVPKNNHKESSPSPNQVNQG